MGIGVSADLATPGLIKFGSEELKQQFLVPTIAGDLVACIGISEAGGGSDVASIKTKAVKRGGELAMELGRGSYIPLPSLPLSSPAPLSSPHLFPLLSSPLFFPLFSPLFSPFFSPPFLSLPLNHVIFSNLFVFPCSDACQGGCHFELK